MIELKNIHKQYKTGDEIVEALKGVNLTFRENEFVAILGPSGGGKTTLLNIIGGLDHYTTGDLIINGKSTANFTDRDWDSYRNHSIGFIFQSYNLIPHQSVLANVELALTISGISKSERKKRALEALEKVGLSSQVNKRPNQMSGGQMQRVAIARALVNNPDILLADEPTGALDTENSIQIMELLKEVAKDRLVIMVTHNPELAEQYANRIVRIKDGQIINDNNPYIAPEETDDFKYNRTGMSLLTALGLSFNNLMSKKARTFLTGFAGSIGIIGIALILSLSNGVNKYIDDIQRESLASYPLTFQTTASDMTALFTAMHNLQFESEQEETIQEVSAMQGMFSSIHTNDLRSFKKYIISNYSEIENDIAKISYDFDIPVTIYSADTSEKITKLNPTSMFSMDGSSNIFMTSMYGSRMNAFSELSEKQLEENSSYTLLMGRQPEKYDEVAIVLMSDKALSDYFAFSIGLRDQEVLNALMSDYMLGKPISFESSTNTYKLEDLMNLKFKVVLAADTYQYNDTYKLWSDISGDYKIMKEIVDNSLELKVVGIYANPDMQMETIAYSPELTNWVIKQSQNKEIVKQQLLTPEINVISGKPFNAIENEELDFSNMFSVDSSKLQRAFNMNISNTQITSMVNKYINKAMSGVADSVEEIADELTGSFVYMFNDMVNNWLEENGYDEVGKLTDEEIKEIVETYFDGETAEQMYQYLHEHYGITRDEFDALYEPLAKAALENYYDLFTKIYGEGYVILTKEVFEAFLNDYVNGDELSGYIVEYAKKIVNTSLNKNLANIGPAISRDLVNLLGSSLSIDTDILTSAFEISFDQNEISRIISSYTTTAASYENNLNMFGYADFEKPESISVYFNNFESKDNFKRWVEAYNDNADKDHYISYTDLTGVLMTSVSTIVDTVSYVLIAFVSISLIVSSIMIAIITYVSVLERTKEIGVLRALGASKRNITQVFNAETFIIGLVSGGLGIICTLLLIIPINNLIHHLTAENVKAVLPWTNAAVLILISVILTMIAGLVPSRLASKKDPVIALRSE